MAPRAAPGQVEPGFSLPALERIAPPPPPHHVAAWIERHSGPGDVVVDLHARGGWVARAAVDRDRRAVSIESGPLTRLLAEIVLRPPDVRHLDAAFQALGAAPRGKTTIRLAIGELFATRCGTCGRALVVDEIVWDVVPDGPAGAVAAPVTKHYRCTVCRDQQGGEEAREAPVDDDDRALAIAPVGADKLRTALALRFPVPDGHEELPEQLVALHTDRQLVGLGVILERIEDELRAEPVEAALRLAFLHAILPASRLATRHGRAASLRISGGRVRRGPAGHWVERNPWLAFEDGFRLVRNFVQRLEAEPVAHVQARFGEDLRSLAEGPATAVVSLAGPATLAALRDQAAELAERSVRPRVRLILGQAPLRPSAESAALTFHATGWVLGRAAAATLPIEALVGSAGRAPWGWQSASLRRSLEAIAPALERDGRAVILLESGGVESLVAAALGAVAAGFRVLAARAGTTDGDDGGFVELLPPGAVVPPAARTRANVALPALPGGAGDPELVPARGIFAAPERLDARPFSAADAARTVSDIAVEVLRARGEPARAEQLLGDILVALDRTGQLRRLVLGGQTATAATAATAAAAADEGSVAPPEHEPALAGAVDNVDRLVALIREELTRPNQRRLVEVEPGSWWLADRDDRASAAAPLPDRTEWAVYSILSTAGALSETAFFERIATLFGEHDLPDEGLIRACLDSYRSPASTRDRLATDDDLLRRSHQHGELLAELADGGHRLGMHVWLALREQSRRVGDRRLGDSLDDRERNMHLPLVAAGPVDALEAIDCIWYVPGRAAFAFEVEWTAMLGDPILRRHGRIPADERLVRFLVVPEERTQLVRHKIQRSPLLRTAIAEGNWHVLKWNHLRTFLAGDSLAIDALEPFLGLDPEIEQSGDQLPLFASEPVG